MEYTRFGERLERSKNDNKNVGIHPQALIRHLKPIINHKTSHNTITNTKETKTRILFTFYGQATVAGRPWVSIIHGLHGTAQTGYGTTPDGCRGGSGHMLRGYHNVSLEISKT